jgi:hypothetical protein
MEDGEEIDFFIQKDPNTFLFLETKVSESRFFLVRLPQELSCCLREIFVPTQPFHAESLFENSYPVLSFCP